MKYKVWKAIAYEITQIIIQERPSLATNWIIKKIRENCLNDWIEYKTKTTMKNVDKQIEAFQDELDLISFKNSYLIIEHPSDGSRAQELLGGPLEIKSAWSNHKRAEY